MKPNIICVFLIACGVESTVHGVLDDNITPYEVTTL